MTVFSTGKNIEIAMLIKLYKLKKDEELLTPVLSVIVN